MNRERIWDWQQRYRQAPAVWTVEELGYEGWDGTRFYDCEEAAEIELKWRRQQNPDGGYRVRCLGNVMSLELSKERWEGEP